MSIKRNISVLNQGITADIDIVYGTDLVPIEFYITDYVLPSNAIATVYCTTSEKELLKRICDIENNIISFEPTVGFFTVGKNNLQIRITSNEKNLYSFEVNINCKGNMVSDDDAKELESQPTLVEQVLTKLGEIPTSDTKDNAVSFESADALNTEKTPLEWSEVELLKSGEKHSSIFAKISAMFKNVRYLAIKMFSHELKDNVVTFDSYDDAEEYDGIWEVPSIAAGEKLSAILSKITKFCNNIRYLFNFVKVNDIMDAGYASVADAINTIGKDYIIERGTSGIWHYTKWASGEVELRTRTGVTCVVETIMSDYCYRSEIQSISLPFTVYETMPQITCFDHNSWATGSYINSTSNAIGVVIMRANSYASYTWRVFIVVKGRWKE